MTRKRTVRRMAGRLSVLASRYERRALKTTVASERSRLMGTALILRGSTYWLYGLIT